MQTGPNSPQLHQSACRIRPTCSVRIAFETAARYRWAVERFTQIGCAGLSIFQAEDVAVPRFLFESVNKAIIPSLISTAVEASVGAGRWFRQDLFRDDAVGPFNQ